MSGDDWIFTYPEIKQRTAYLLKSGHKSDCAFLFGTGEHQVLVQGHKFILAVASPVFDAMFYGEMAESEKPIPILDVQPEPFKAMLRYIYTDTVDLTTFDKACEIYHGANKYMLSHLIKKCTEYILNHISPKNACRAYEFAKFYEESILMEKCISTIRTNTSDVLTDSSFDEVEWDTLIMVLSQDKLTIGSEMDLFRALQRYAIARGMGKREGDKGEQSTSEASKETEKKQYEANKLSVVAPVCTDDNSNTLPGPHPSTPSGNPQETGAKEQEKLLIRRALGLIRFLTLTPKQFAQGPALSFLLTESESYAVFTNMLSDNAV